MDQGYGTDLSARRRRKVLEQAVLPDPRVSYDEESSSTTQTKHTMSAHESKILRRRDKSFSTNRSHSQPRQAEKITNPEAFQIISANKRSLSSPRHKEEEMYKQQQRLPVELSEDDRLTRLEKNLQRFEEERLYFDKEKKRFEREKREHKMRYRQMLDEEQRRRMIENYRKLSDRSSEAEEKKRLIQSLRQSYRESALSDRPALLKPRYMEESSALESSDAEVVPRPQALHLHEKKIVSRHHSLSPLRAERLFELDGQYPGEINGQYPIEKYLTEVQIFSQSQEEPIYENVPRKSESVPRKPKSPTPPTGEKPERPKKPVRRSVSRSAADNKDVQVVKPVRRRSRVSIDSETQDASLLPPAPPPTPAVEVEKPQGKTGMFSFFLKKKEKIDAVTPDDVADDAAKGKEKDAAKKKWFPKYRDVWAELKQDHPKMYQDLILIRNQCVGHFMILTLMCGFGGLLFRYTEGYLENIYKCEVRKVKRDFIDSLWTQSHHMREDDWKTQARNRLRKFEEELVKYSELNGPVYPGAEAWNFVNSVLYCWTVVTTIGYGHIVPQTYLGKSITIIYAVIGIPMFLIILADFGKLFTRGVKFVWAYVRRLYYHGTCRKVRKHQHVLDVMNGINTMYDVAIRRPSTYFFDTNATYDIESGNKQPPTPMSTGTHFSQPDQLDTPTTTYPETFEVDDEFNLPISLACSILILYIIAGALMYSEWEKWQMFDSFYFVFISMSTIGFGDIVPKHPIFMMCSILYLVFGLALTSMVINVVQIKLSDTFKDASSKLGATIGLNMAGSQSQLDSPKDEEMPGVHGKSKLNDISEAPNEEPSTSTQFTPPPLPQRTENVPSEGDGKKKKRRFFGKN